MSNRIFTKDDPSEGWSDATIKEVLDLLAHDDCLTEGVMLHTGIKEVPIPIRYMPNAQEILEQYDETCYENNGEWVSDRTGSDTVSAEAEKQLDDFLRNWALKNLKITFFEVDYIENFDLTQEMIDAYRQGIEIPLPEFEHKEAQ